MHNWIFSQEWRELFEHIERQGFITNWPKDGGNTVYVKHSQDWSVTICLSRNEGPGRWVATAAAYHQDNDYGSWSAIETDDAAMISQMEQLMERALKWALGIGGAAA